MSVIDLRRETPDVAKHIVDSINAMANIKKEQINIQKSLMLDKIERERNLETRGKEKQQDVDFENKKNQSLIDMFAPQEPRQSQTVEQPVPGHGGGMITGQAEDLNSYPKAVRDPVWRGMPLITPGKLGKTLSAEDVSYGGVYKKVMGGEDIYEGEEEILFKYNEKAKLFEKIKEVEGNIAQGGIFNQKEGQLIPLDAEQSAAYVQSELGTGWEKKYTEIKKMIDSRFSSKRETLVGPKPTMGQNILNALPLPGRIKKNGTYALGGKERSDEKVMVISPEGKRGKLPKANLSDALKRGFKLVQ